MFWIDYFNDATVISVNAFQLNVSIRNAFVHEQPSSLFELAEQVLSKTSTLSLVKGKTKRNIENWNELQFLFELGTVNESSSEFAEIVELIFSSTNKSFFFNRNEEGILTSKYV